MCGICALELAWGVTSKSGARTSVRYESMMESVWVHVSQFPPSLHGAYYSRYYSHSTYDWLHYQGTIFTFKHLRIYLPTSVLFLDL